MQKIKAIFNAKNFGQFNSHYYSLLQTTGDCAIMMCVDFQDPIYMIPKLVGEWGVSAIKTTSKENKIMRFLRTCYYKAIKRCLTLNKLNILSALDYMTRNSLILCENLKILRRFRVVLLRNNWAIKERIYLMSSSGVKQEKQKTIGTLFMTLQCLASRHIQKLDSGCVQ